jgi:ribonuclease HI
LLLENALNIFTDGSSLRSPRRGGIGIRFILVDPEGNEELQDAQFPGYPRATNNQMELQACILALEEVDRLHLLDAVPLVVIQTDSLYVKDNVRNALFEWPRTRWRLRTGRPVLNAQLWKRLTRLVKNSGKRVEFKWVRGHAKSEHNKAADRMARQSAALATNQPLSIVHVRRKLTPHSVDVGCVPMHGQRMSIRVITTEFLPVQKLWKCKYEVVSKSSTHQGLVDIIFSKDLLQAGHSYYIQVNRDSANPSILKVFREMLRQLPRSHPTVAPGPLTTHY